MSDSPTAPLFALPDGRQVADFPASDFALDDPNGLLAVGGDLAPARLLGAYRRGIFPWYSSGQPLLWWTPDPRAVLTPATLHISRSLRRTLRRRAFELSADRAFDQVMAACAGPRTGQAGTWITAAMRSAYNALHQQGTAHSVECWMDGKLAGGLYGLAIGRVFFGESMFAHRRDASKIALAALCSRLRDWGYELIDCQVENPHLESLGAHTMARAQFESALARLTALAPRSDAWSGDWNETEFGS